MATSPEAQIDFGPVVDVVGNHSAKMVTLLLFDQSSPGALGKSQLGSAFIEAQGEEPGWDVRKGRLSAPFSYCQHGMAPLLLDETQIPSQRGEGKFVQAFKINDQGKQMGIPLCGAGLEWESTYDHASLSQILGQTTSATRIDRMPSLRLKIYEQLLAATGPISRTELQRAVGETAARFMQLIPNLRDAGIIDITERYNPRHREVRLSTPDFDNLRRAGSRVHPETHALFEVVAELVQQHKTNMTGQDLLDAVTTRYPQYDPAFIWKRLTIARSSGAMRFVEFKPFNSNKDQKTIVVLSPQYRDAISNLVQSICHLETDETYRTEMAARAKDIMHDTELVADLMAKARRNSVYTDTATRHEWQEYISSWLPSDGIGSYDLYELVRADAPSVNYTQFRRILKDLEGSGYSIVWGEARGRMRRTISRIEPDDR